MALLSSTCLPLAAPAARLCNSITQEPRSGLKLVYVGWPQTNGRFRSLRVPCVAKAETVQKVCEIVRKQLALPAETELTPESKFASLGADSLDTVEIVMGLEEEFGINVEEESSNNITTVQEAADLIERLVQKKSETA